MTSRALLLVLACVSATSCALLSGRLPCAKDSDCLAGDVCASDGQCAPGRSTSSEGEGEGASSGEGEGEGEGEGTGARVRTVTTTIGSIVDVGVELDDAFSLHVLPFGKATCAVDDDCSTSTACNVNWSSTVTLILSDAGAGHSEGAQNIGDATVGIVVETSSGFAGGDATLLGNVSGTVSLPAGKHFTEVTYASAGAPVDCINATDDFRCSESFSNACP